MLFVFFLSSKMAAGDFSVGLLKLEGDTTYFISSENMWTESLLEFPLDIELLEIEYKHDINKYYIDKISISLSHSLFSTYSGIFKDTDYRKSNGDKIVYSESSAGLYAYMADINLQTESYNIKELADTKISFSIGCQKRVFDFRIYDSVQESYFTGQQRELPGNNLFYNIKYNIPYLGVEINNCFLSESLCWELFYLYSPVVSVKDYDDHILREQIRKSVTSGTADILGLDFVYNYSNNTKFRFGLEYTDINTTGTQELLNYDHDIITDNIDSEIKSRQKTICFGLDYCF